MKVNEYVTLNFAASLQKKKGWGGGVIHANVIYYI